VHLGKVSSSKESTEDELVLKIQEDSSGLKGLDPVFDYLLIGTIELKALTLGHEDESPHLLVGVLEMCFLEPRILAVENTPLHGVILRVELDEAMANQHHVLLLEIGCF
jgi:hypothetical protein